MTPPICLNTISTDQRRRFIRHRSSAGLLSRTVKAGATLLGVAILGALSLPLMLLYLLVMLIWIGFGAISLSYLVSAALAVLVWLYEGDPHYAWRAVQFLAAASAWFSLVVVGSYLHGSALDWLDQRERDEPFER